MSAKTQITGYFFYYIDAGLVRTGRLFGGLINDIKRKAPWYWSDFKDAFAVQTIASYIFIYFACLTPIVTFGGLLGDATENRIAAIESLVSGLIVGVSYGLFSGTFTNICLYQLLNKKNVFIRDSKEISII